MTIWKPPAMDFPWPCVVSRGNQWQEALGCLENLDARAIQCDTILFNSVISACGKSGQWQTALELMQLTLQQAKVFRENDSHPLPLLLNVPNIENQGGRAVMRGRGLRWGLPHGRTFGSIAPRMAHEEEFEGQKPGGWCDSWPGCRDGRYMETPQIKNGTWNLRFEVLMFLFCWTMLGSAMFESHFFVTGCLYISTRTPVPSPVYQNIHGL